MGTTPNKARIIQTITSAAVQYKQHLVGKTFLYVFEGRMIEVAYHAKEFRHLTGVAARGLTALSFYDKAVDGTLQESQIYFDVNHRFHLCKRKMKHIQNLASVANSALIVLEDAGTATETYHFAFTELKFTLCLGRDIDPVTGSQKSDYYIVKSLRDGDGNQVSAHGLGKSPKQVVGMSRRGVTTERQRKMRTKTHSQNSTNFGCTNVLFPCSETELCAQYTHNHR